MPKAEVHLGNAGQDEDGGEGDRSPTDEALKVLEDEIQEHLAEMFLVESVDAFADFDDLLGVDE